MRPTRVAIVQWSPAVLDAKACVERVCRGVGEAAEQGARLAVFPETFIPTYPLWCDGGVFGKWDHEPSEEVHARYLESSIEVPSDETRRVGQAAADHQCHVAVGVSERAGRSLYNALLLFDETGQLVLHRRKLVPTHGERLVWRTGDAHDLAPVDTSVGRVGGLICWEHWMPLPRQVLHDRGEEIHLALWPGVREMHLIASRHHAFEGRCFVLAAGMILRRGDFPPDFPLGGEWGSAPETLISGGSAIIAPDGLLLAGPAKDEETILIADLDPSLIAKGSLTLDAAGHYARPDLFRLEVDDRRIPERPSGSPLESG